MHHILLPLFWIHYSDTVTAVWSVFCPRLSALIFCTVDILRIVLMYWHLEWIFWIRISSYLNACYWVHSSSHGFDDASGCSCISYCCDVLHNDVTCYNNHYLLIDCMVHNEQVRFLFNRMICLSMHYRMSVFYVPTVPLEHLTRITRPWSISI